LTALTHERLGVLARLQKADDEAKKRFQESLKIREELAKLEPNNLSWLGAYAVALARAGRSTDAINSAQMLFDRKPGAELLLQVARCRALCAAAETDSTRKAELITKSLAALQAAVSAGWKDSSTIETDPDLIVLRDDAAYRELLTGLKRTAPKP
jgi:predicted Zn-dependent protease